MSDEKKPPPPIEDLWHSALYCEAHPTQDLNDSAIIAALMLIAGELRELRILLGRHPSNQ